METEEAAWLTPTPLLFSTKGGGTPHQMGVPQAFGSGNQKARISSLRVQIPDHAWRRICSPDS